MMDHVENLHLSKQLVDQRIICHHPVYKAEGLILNNVMHFKNHAGKHGNGRKLTDIRKNSSYGKGRSGEKGTHRVILGSFMQGSL